MMNNDDMWNSVVMHGNSNLITLYVLPLVFVGIEFFFIFINIVVRDMFSTNDMTRLTLAHEFTFIIVLFNKYHSNYSGTSNFHIHSTISKVVKLGYNK